MKNKSNIYLVIIAILIMVIVNTICYITNDRLLQPHSNMAIATCIFIIVYNRWKK